MATKAPRGTKAARTTRWAVVGLLKEVGATSDDPRFLEAVFEGLDSLDEAHAYMAHNEARFLADITPGARFKDWWAEAYTGIWWSPEV
jgi:hypothetical protein